jgi:hypothetical protein
MLIGGDENSAKDMGLYVAALDRFKVAFGSCVLSLHHTGRNGDHERGSTALRSAAEVSIQLTGGADPDRLSHTLSCAKQKHGAAPFKPIHVRLIPTGDEAEENTTCTVKAADEGDAGAVARAREGKREQDDSTTSRTYGTSLMYSTRRVRSCRGHSWPRRRQSPKAR